MKVPISNLTRSECIGKKEFSRIRHSLIHINKIMNAVDLFKSLSEPVRLRLLHVLANTEPELCVCDLVALLGCPQGTISRHLTQLRHIGLVSDRREGVWVYYRLTEPETKAHAAMLECLKSCFSDDQLLAEDIKLYKSLKKNKSLACCTPQHPQGRPIVQSVTTRNMKVKA